MDAAYLVIRNDGTQYFFRTSALDPGEVGFLRSVHGHHTYSLDVGMAFVRFVRDRVERQDAASPEVVVIQQDRVLREQHALSAPPGWGVTEISQMHLHPWDADALLGPRASYSFF